jgi:transcriptional regulator with XRE-family HTH domain
VTAQQILFIRQTLNLSQRDLARALGVAQVTVSRWETSEHEPTGLQLEVLRALHQSALTVQNDGTKRAIVAGLVGMGIGALLFLALTEAGREATSREEKPGRNT